MNSVLFEILNAAIIVAIIIGVRYFVPWIKEYTSLAQNDLLSSLVTAAVQYAEQICKRTGSGAEKKAIVTEFLKEQLSAKNISISDEQLNALIESAVYAMNVAKQADSIGRKENAYE